MMRLLRLCMLLLALLAAGCNMSATAAPTEQPTPESPLTPVVENVITAMEAGDADTLRELARFTTIACTTVDGLGGPPKCQGDEEDGDMVEAFPFLASEGGWVRLDEIDMALPDGEHTLYAVYRVRGLRDTFGAVFLPKESNPANWGVTLIIDAVGVTGANYADIDRLMAAPDIDVFVVAPGG